MSLQIPITGIDQGYKTPGAYAEILFAQGPANAASPAREVVLVMPKLSTGTWTAATRYEIKSEKDASDGAGPGSPLHRAARLFLQANRSARLWAVPVAETTGGSPAAATSTITLATTASASGTVVATIAGEDCSAAFKSGDTVTVSGDALAASINAKTWLPVTAANVTGTITLTAKLKGVSQGTASLVVIRVRATITSGAGTTVATSGSLGTGVAGAEGSTTEATNFTTALAALAAVRHYYVVSSANDTTSYANLATHIANKSEPRLGLRSVGIVAYPGTLAATQTLALARNTARLSLVHQKNPESDTAELAANYAAVRQKREAVDPAFNFDDYRGTDWLIKPAFATADWPTNDDVNDAINDGITEIGSDSNGSRICMSCTTQSKNAAGTVDDFRATQTRVVSETDNFVDEQLVDWALTMAGKKLSDDERLADGSVNTNQRLIRNVIRPSMLAAKIRKRMDDHEQAGLLQNATKTKESVDVRKTGSRLEAGFDLEVINWLDQGTFRVAEISTG